MNQRNRAGISFRPLWLLPAMLPLLTGCVSRLARYTVHVRLSETIADSQGVLPNVEAHLVAVNPADGERLMRMPMPYYWDPNRRPDDFPRRVLLLGGQRQGADVVAENDPIWRRWNYDRAMDLFVLADLPGTYESQPGVEDRRQLVIPLERTRRWIRPRRTLWILIDESVRNVTPRGARAAPGRYDRARYDRSRHDAMRYDEYDPRQALPTPPSGVDAGSVAPDAWRPAAPSWTVPQ